MGNFTNKTLLEQHFDLYLEQLAREGKKRASLYNFRNPTRQLIKFLIEKGKAEPKQITLADLDLHFTRIAVKPGKPMTFASSDTKAVFGLPGNPVAVFLMFHLFILYAARLMGGIKLRLRYVKFPLVDDFHRDKADRMAFLPCQLTTDGLLKQIDYHGSAHLRALLDCDGFFIVPKGVTDIQANKQVNFLSIKDSFE